MLLLDLAATDDARAKLVTDVKAAIEKDGTLIGHHDWGQRALTYEIGHREQAEYHLIQLHATPALLSSLERSLRIADAVVRHRMIKLAPGTPGPPEVAAEQPRAAAVAAPSRPAEAAAEPSVEAAAEPSVDAPAAPAAV